MHLTPSNYHTVWPALYYMKVLVWIPLLRWALASVTFCISLGAGAYHVPFLKESKII